MNSFRAIGIFVFSFSICSYAADGGGRFNFNAREKVEKKAGSRWTLQEWLAQKERNRLMDLWLAMYSPSPYEFFLKGATHSSSTSVEPPTTDSTSHQSYSGGVGAYATIIGLEGAYENNTDEKYNDLTGSLNLRVLGNAVQGTHLSLRYGLRTRAGTTTAAMGGLGDGGTVAGATDYRISSQFAGADLNLYLTRYFGLAGLYHHYLPVDEPTFGTVTGSRTEAGAFIDFEMVRIFGQWFSDSQINDQSGTITTIKRTGTQIGLQFFF